jgi:hypothetical protein
VETLTIRAPEKIDLKKMEADQGAMLKARATMQRAWDAFVEARDAYEKVKEQNAAYFDDSPRRGRPPKTAEATA